MVPKIARAFEQAFDLGSAWTASFVVELSMMVLGLGGTLKWIEGSSTSRVRRTAHQALRPNDDTVNLAYSLSPFPNTCLRRSLVRYWLGRRRGLPVRFVLGVRLHERFEAHAWVEGESEAQYGDCESFDVLLRSPGAARGSRR